MVDDKAPLTIIELVQKTFDSERGIEETLIQLNSPTLYPVVELNISIEDEIAFIIE